MWYLMAACIYQEIYTIQFRGNLNGMCVNTYIENEINYFICPIYHIMYYYILIVYTLV